MCSCVVDVIRDRDKARDDNRFLRSVADIDKMRITRLTKEVEELKAQSTTVYGCGVQYWYEAYKEMKEQRAELLSNRDEQLKIDRDAAGYRAEDLTRKLEAMQSERQRLLNEITGYARRLLNVRRACDE